MAFLQPTWLQEEFRHGIIAFGGGALFAAVALVLVPEGSELLSPLPAVALFVLGGLAFAGLDAFNARRKGAGAQFLAMISDFLPEAAALGALLAGDVQAGMLLAAIIALQNLPESFNAWREMSAGDGPGPHPSTFWALVLVGPAAAFVGHEYLSQNHTALGVVMLFSAGGITYLIFEDIAPSIPLEKTWLPPLGAIFGFALGMGGQLLVG